MIKALIFFLLCVCRSHQELEYCNTKKHTYMVAIVHARHTFENGCSGTLITPTWVLTSVNCMIYCITPSLYVVIAAFTGLYQELEADPKKDRSSVVAYCYKSKNKYYGIGLMELETPIEASDDISYIRVATYLDMKGLSLAENCYSAYALGVKLNKPLTCVRTGVLEQKRCPFKNNKELSCIHSISGKNDICPIGNGGPIICDDMQFGVLFINSSCHEGVPQIIARVDEFEDFILKVVTEHMVPRSSAERVQSIFIIKLIPIFLLLLSNSATC